MRSKGLDLIQLAVRKGQHPTMAFSEVIPCLGEVAAVAVVHLLLLRFPKGHEDHLVGHTLLDHFRSNGALKFVGKILCRDLSLNLTHVDDSRHDLEKILGINVAVAKLSLESEADARAARSLVTGGDFLGVLAAFDLEAI